MATSLVVTRSSTKPRLNNLIIFTNSSPPADFVGRDAELKILREYVKEGGATICAVRGLGGLGKTALASNSLMS